MADACSAPVLTARPSDHAARTARRLVPLVAIAAACGGEGRAGDPAGVTPGNAAAGRVAFETSCASCHASRDGFDLAYFDFAAADIVRRALDHVDRPTAEDIVAWVGGLRAERHDRSYRPFQPGQRIVGSDTQFWVERFGTTEWPAELTPAALAAVDLRDVPVPLPFPLWSSEADESDWMPERPLPPELLDAEGGALSGALGAYYARPDVPGLLRVIEAFERVAGHDAPVPVPVCEGSAGAHTRPVDCFEARRWVSALAAQHLLRTAETRSVPYEVAKLWWDTGEAAVTASFRSTAVTRRDAVAWLYLASMFAPDGFLPAGGVVAEDASYMGQFLVSEGLPRLAVYVTLRRMVAAGAIHAARPEQAYWDLFLATLRSPTELRADVAGFGLRFLLDRQGIGIVPSGEGAVFARGVMDEGLTRLFAEDGGSGDAERDEAILELIERVRAGLGG